MPNLTTSLGTAFTRLSHLLLRGSYIPTDYYVFDDLKTVYISIPKVACTSIKTACLEKYTESGSKVMKHMDAHGAATEFRTFSLNKHQKKHYTFAFVRNPFDRLVSCYEDKVRKEVQHSGQYHFATNYNNIIVRKLTGRTFHPEMSFTDFTKLVADIPDYISDGHFRSQHSFLYHRGKALADYVGKFETLQEDWLPIAQKLGISELPQRNMTNRKNWSDYYTDTEAINLIAKRYQKDFDYFDYSSSIVHPLNP